MHRQVQADPSLRARVQAALDQGPGSASGAASGGPEPGWRGAPADQPPTAAGASGTGAGTPAPGASPQQESGGANAV